MYLGTNQHTLLEHMCHIWRELTVIPPHTSVDEVSGIHSNSDKRRGNHEIDDHSDNAYISLGGWIDEVGSDTVWPLQCRRGIRIGGWWRHGEKRR